MSDQRHSSIPEIGHARLGVEPDTRSVGIREIGFVRSRRGWSAGVLLAAVALASFAGVMRAGHADAVGPGDLDPTWGTAGVAKPAALTGTTVAGVATLVDGRVVIAANLDLPGNFDVGYVARFKSNGTLDSTFGTGGIYTAQNAHFNGLATYTDGYVLAFGRDVFLNGTTMQREAMEILLTDKGKPATAWGNGAGRTGDRGQSILGFEAIGDLETEVVVGAAVPGEAGHMAEICTQVIGSASVAAGHHPGFRFHIIYDCFTQTEKTRFHTVVGLFGPPETAGDARARAIVVSPLPDHRFWVVGSAALFSGAQPTGTVLSGDVYHGLGNQGDPANPTRVQRLLGAWQPTAVALQGGEVVVAGTGTLALGTATRLHPTSLATDPAFGSNGVATLATANPRGINAEATGELMVADASAALLRLSKDGHTGSVSQAAVGKTAVAASTIDLDGRTFVAGNNGGSAVVAKFFEPLPVLSISSRSANEGASAPIVYHLSRPALGPVRVDYGDAAVTATRGVDYFAPHVVTSGDAATPTPFFQPGEVQITDPRAVEALVDTISEGDETLSVTPIYAYASGRSHVTVAPPATYTIKDTNGPARLVLDSPTVTEGDAGTTNMTFTVSINNNRNTTTATSSKSIAVNYATTFVGGAASDADYVPVSGTVTLPAGAHARTFTVAVKGDAIDEANENVEVVLSSIQGPAVFPGGGASSQGFGTIVDDDAPPTVSIASPTLIEGTGTNGPIADFTVTLSAASGRNISFDATTFDGTAVAYGDYYPASRAVVIPAGTISTHVGIEINADATDEPDQQFVVRLSNLVNTRAAGNTAPEGTATIVDDDAEPQMTVGNATVEEGDVSGPGAHELVFPVHLSAFSGFTVEANAVTEAGSAQSGVDYQTVDTTVSFPFGTTTAFVHVPIIGDLNDEADETLTLRLSAPSHAYFVDPANPASSISAVGTILDDDVTPVISAVGPGPIVEGDTGTRSATFTVSLSVPAKKAVTVDYDSQPEGGDRPKGEPGVDFTDFGGTLTFFRGEQTKTVTVQVIGDTVEDGTDEWVSLHLSNPVNATFAAGAPQLFSSFPIADNDEPMLIYIQGLGGTGTEGNPGDSHSFYTLVQLSSARDTPVSVDVATGAPAEPGDQLPTATEGVDYTSVHTTLIFQPGERFKVVTIALIPDTTVESREIFRLTFANPQGAPFAAGTASVVGVYQINDDDRP